MVVGLLRKNITSEENIFMILYQTAVANQRSLQDVAVYRKEMKLPVMFKPVLNILSLILKLPK